MIAALQQLLLEAMKQRDAEERRLADAKTQIEARATDRQRADLKKYGYDRAQLLLLSPLEHAVQRAHGRVEGLRVAMETIAA